MALTVVITAVTWIVTLHHSSPPRPAAVLVPPVVILQVSRPARADRLMVDASDRRSCPATAVACVDLRDRLTWLQSDGEVSYGPVRMEPGRPGTRHATPRGVFHVLWKAGPVYFSTVYGEPMPYAVFFGPDGIAFHGGTLATYSHGCVHLSARNARYFNQHLPLGAKVVVFLAVVCQQLSSSVVDGVWP